MNQLEQFREQCAKIVSKFVGTDQIVEEIRAMPLPEVNQKPDAWLCTDLDGHFGFGFDKKLAKQNAGYDCDEFYPLYFLPPDVEALRKENEQLKHMVGLDKNDPIPEWEMIEPTFWKGANLTVIGDRHLPNGRRQHLVKETSGELREFGNADIFYSEGVK